MVRRAVLVLALQAVAAPCVAQTPDTGAMPDFMKQMGFTTRHGAWFKYRDVDRITDSLKVYTYATPAVAPDLSGFARGTVFTTTFGIACHNPTSPVFMLVSQDTAHRFEKAEVWVRYRVDDHLASEWAKWDGQTNGSIVVAVSTDTVSPQLLGAMLSGSRRLVVRVRGGRVERDYFFLLSGFGLAYVDCVGR